MAGRNSEKCDAGPSGVPSSLLPVAQRVNADAQGFCEFFLRQAGKTAKRGELLFGFDLPANEAFSLPGWNSACKVLLVQFPDNSDVPRDASTKRSHRVSQVLRLVPELSDGKHQVVRE